MSQKMYSESLLLCIFLSSWLLLTQCGQCQAQNPEYIVPVHTRGETAPWIPYENSAPIIFRFKIPSWNWDQNPFLVTGVDTCSTPNGITDHSYCPLYYQLQIARDNLRSLFQLKGMYELTETGYLQHTYWTECARIQKHFSSQRVTDNRVNAYLYNMQECHGLLYLEKALDTRYDTNFQSSYYTGQQFYSMYYHDGELTLEKNASHAVATAALTTSGFVHYLAEVTRWKDALSFCSAGKTPMTLITQSMFADALTELKVKLADTDFELVDEDLPGYIASYFNAPLTDCTMTKGGQELVVRVMVPLQNKRNVWMDHVISAVPFRLSRNGSFHICHVEEFRPAKHFHKEFSSKIIVENLCDRSSQLCHIDEETASWKQTCADAILTLPMPPDFATRCPLTCQPESDFNLPVVERGNSNEFFIAGPVVLVTVRCPSTGDTLHPLPSQGALRIKLPCGCSIVDPRGRIHMAKYPCSSQTSVRTDIVLPLHEQKSYT